MAKKIFIAATMQNDGKTTVSLGLIAALSKSFKRIGFIKPIGQRYLIEQGFKVDEDSLLIDEVFGVTTHIKDMSPIAIEKGFTEKYILNGPAEDYLKKIRQSISRIAEESDLVVIEGTGHAGVGSVFDLSNAAVARALGANAIIISSGGIGKPIDEIMLNKALFDKEGVRIAGVIVNKVLPGKYKKVNSIVRVGLEKKGLNVLGVVPFMKMLEKPSMREIVDELKLKVLYGEKNLHNAINQNLVCAMAVKRALLYIKGKTLIITPGDREDIITAAVKTHCNKKENRSISGIILNGGIIPGSKCLALMKKSGIPILVTGEDTYAIASRVYAVKVKIKPKNAEKIAVIKDMIGKYIDIDKVLKGMK
ncbi:MAG: AAA family ATPase [Candidatus Omnitrophota bacterium]